MIALTLGSIEGFFNFLGKLKKEDRVAVISHTDLDGIASAVFLNIILRSKGIKPEIIEFIDYGEGGLKKLRPALEKRGINKVLFADMAIESADREEFIRFKKDHDYFIIDHHPLMEDFEYSKNILKTESEDCSALTIFKLAEKIMGMRKWDWLVCSALISEYSFKKKENLEFLRKKYPEDNINRKEIYNNKPGRVARKIKSSLIYCKSKGKNIRDIYLILLKGEQGLEKLENYGEEVEKEIQKYIDEFEEKAEYYEGEGLYWYEVEPEFRIGSVLANRLSDRNPKEVIILMRPDKNKKGIFNFNLRCQKEGDVNSLVRKAAKPFKEKSVGGHKAAAGARIKKEDVQEFKKRILRILEK
jgi:single-stranded DNA-specific DHH superfamily exonuclease